LALYRYWNIIQYYFPYKNLIEEDWKGVLEEFIPKVIDARNETDYTLTMLELIGRIHDTHASIWGNNPILNDYWGLKSTPIELTFIENKPVVTGFCDAKLGKETGLEKGDVITKINNKLVEEIVEERLKYTPASNYPTKLRDIPDNLLKTNDSIINITYIRNDKEHIVSLKTYYPNYLYRNYYKIDEPSFKLINKDIAYINNGTVKTKEIPRIWEQMKNTKGLIIDIRNYPSDNVPLSNYLMPKRKSFVKFSMASIKNPGLFTYFFYQYKAGKKRKDYYKGKVIILLNEITQSAAEFDAMEYRTHPNATVIGSTTAGADGDVADINLPGGIKTMISGIGIYYPDGRETQRIGIVPDIEVKPTIQGIKKGEDELLEKAIEIINGK
jgi:C-terminal processing protease CtpA/Prc